MLCPFRILNGRPWKSSSSSSVSFQNTTSHIFCKVYVNVWLKCIQCSTRSTQRAQTSAERQHNRIVENCSSRIRIVIRNGLPDPDSDADRHQNVISWSLGHTPALHKISSKSLGNFFDNPVNADFGLRTPGSGQWSGSSPKLNSLVPGPCPTSPPRNFVKIRSQLFQLSDGQTNRPK